jgi:hypothetical protein
LTNYSILHTRLACLMFFLASSAAVTVCWLFRHQKAFVTLLRISPAIHHLAAQPEFADLLGRAALHGLFTTEVHECLQNWTGLLQWDTETLFEFLTALLESGRSLHGFWHHPPGQPWGQPAQPRLPALSRLTAEQIWLLLDLCVRSAGSCLSSMQHLLRLPAAADLEPWHVVILAEGLIAMQPRDAQLHGSMADSAYSALQVLLRTAAAQRLAPAEAAHLLTAAAEASRAVTPLLQKELPQLQGVDTGSSMQQQQEPSLLQRLFGGRSQQPLQLPQQPSFLQRLFGSSSSSRQQQQRAELLQLQAVVQAGQPNNRPLLSARHAGESMLPVCGPSTMAAGGFPAQGGPFDAASRRVHTQYVDGSVAGKFSSGVHAADAEVA